ncbi:REP-associated tyrosine transposase [Actinobacillus porcinus]|uniref:REP-associated tyrosine transposase n=1 Tax=Actinobacillus porcinus TaxID=51048 RepID=UPI0023573590|nr:transposase [Actinobacillus porcinus]MCI5764666.1 transposase [Actinobacillus porcinus]MDY5420771.1 transposase [Actinobacillus porcinus]
MQYRRKPYIRLPFYDYAQYGCYFVTICTKNRAKLFGDVVNSKMQLSPIGIIIENHLLSLTQDFPNNELTDYVIMPNHLHFIWFNKTTSKLSDIVRKFKGKTSKAYHSEFKNIGYEPLWQRSYYEHIIRDEKDYLRISEYIENNPIMWVEDRFYAEI